MILLYSNQPSTIFAGLTADHGCHDVAAQWQSGGSPVGHRSRGDHGRPLCTAGRRDGDSYRGERKRGAEGESGGERKRRAEEESRIGERQRRTTEKAVKGWRDTVEPVRVPTRRCGTSQVHTGGAKVLGHHQGGEGATFFCRILCLFARGRHSLMSESTLVSVIAPQHMIE